MDINELYHLANIFMYNTFEEQKNRRIKQSPYQNFSVWLTILNIICIFTFNPNSFIEKYSYRIVPTGSKGVRGLYKGWKISEFDGHRMA